MFDGKIVCLKNRISVVFANKLLMQLNFGSFSSFRVWLKLFEIFLIAIKYKIKSIRVLSLVQVWRLPNKNYKWYIWKPHNKLRKNVQVYKPTVNY